MSVRSMDIVLAIAVCMHMQTSTLWSTLVRTVWGGELPKSWHLMNFLLRPRASAKASNSFNEIARLNRLQNGWHVRVVVGEASRKCTSVVRRTSYGMYVSRSNAFSVAEN